MVTIFLVVYILYLLVVLAADWDSSGNVAANKRIVDILILLMAIFAIIALNDGFTFPTDLQEIRRRSTAKE